MTKDEFLQIEHNYKSRDLITFTCECCKQEHARIKKNILRSLKSDKVEFVFCSNECYSKFNSTIVSCNCSNCGKEFERGKNKIKENAFCSSKCSASYNNRQRSPTSNATKEKISDALKEYHENTNFNIVGDSTKYIKSCFTCQGLFTSLVSVKKYCSKSCSTSRSRKPKDDSKSQRKGVYCPVVFKDCQNCNMMILISPKHKKYSKFCSDLCRTTWRSNFQSERLKKSENRKNLGRHRRSYLESSFENWLRENNIEFETEIHFRNTELNKSYYVDFLFRDLNLVIELDGKQHENTKEKDAIRDEYLKRVYNLDIMRVTHKEYTKQTRLFEIKERLKLN